MIKKLLLLVNMIVLSIAASAQEGIIRGVVIEDAIGEPMIAVTVAVAGTGTGTITDFDGTFEIRTEPGIYSLEVSFLGFQTLTITDVEVVDGEVVVFDNIRMVEESELLEEVVITATAVRNTEAALLTIQRKSPNLLDGISSQTFKKIGDSDAADAVKRVTGVSVEGGKYVYVRGLGDRYTKTMLNSVDIPGLDPDRNSLQIDIFPTNLINNMFVLKSAVADMPADFTGGVVNIETKDFPEERVFDISASIGFNPDMHLNSDFLSYQGGDSDFLGFDDGTRELPEAARVDNIPSPISGASDTEVANFLNQFSPTLGTQRETNFMDYSLGVTLANQVKLNETNNNTLGYIFSATYKNSSTFYDDLFYGDYQLNQDPNINELIYANRLSGESGTRNVLLGGLAGLAYKTKNAKYKLNIMHLQNGENEAAILRLDNNDDARGQSGYIANSDNLEYGQRGLTNILLNGKHFTEDGSWTIDWRLSPTISRIDEPDIRKTAFTEIGARETFAAGAGGLPSRLWRNLEEVNLVGRIDLTKEFEINEEAAKFKFGFSQVNKERDYEILQYSVQFFGAQPTWTGNANEVLQPANTFPSGTIYYASGNTFPNPNEYNSTVSNTAGYASLEFTPLTKVKTVVGLRAEKFLQKHTGRDQRGEFDLVDAEVLDALDFFPSANIIYGVSEKQNLRVSYSRTIARPSFKELSFAQILDPASNRLFNGGLFPFEGEWDGNLRETLINNFDIRWEFFGDRAQLFSVSGFYKSFADPIELVRIPEQVTITEVQPRNVGDGTVFGVEVEFRKALDFLAEENSPWSVSGNLTLANSSIDRTPSEIRSREDNARTGQDIADTRQMAGQAPYIINAGLSYNNPDKGFDAGLFYNVKGPTLLIVGGGIFPDVFTEPFNSLNFNLNKNIGEEQRTSLNFKVSNLLGDVREEVFTGFEAENQLYTRFSPGISFGLGVKYSIY